MKALLAAIGAATALTCSSTAIASVPVALAGSYTFEFSGDCEDCAEEANQVTYPVSATLMVQNYVLGLQFNNGNFVQFVYGGSNLIPGGFTVTDWDLISLNGAIGATPGPYNVDIVFNNGHSGFSTSANGAWYTGDLAVANDFGNNGTWNASTTQPGGVPEPGAWGMMLIGLGLIGGAMRVRKGQQARVCFAA